MSGIAQHPTKLAEYALVSRLSFFLQTLTQGVHDKPERPSIGR